VVAGQLLFLQPFIDGGEKGVDACKRTTTKKNQWIRVPKKKVIQGWRPHDEESTIENEAPLSELNQIMIAT
jgi:hypothetical protein